MLGLALEGGGARGAYHIGVFKAYMENGYVFDGYAGASIGAINAAVLTLGDFDKAYRLWMGLSMDHLFDADEEDLIELGNIKLNITTIAGALSSLKKIIGERGIDTSKMREILVEHIDDSNVRLSNKVMGLVTVSIEELKPYELYLDQIPEGKLIDYLMASASFPGFQSAKINKKAFIDGGIYNNCPINMLCEKGFDEIIAVRTLAPGRFKSIKKYSSANIKIIEPSGDLGNILIFSHDKIEENIKLGYYDGLKAIKQLRGKSFYLNPATNIDFSSRLLKIDNESILKAGKHLGIKGIPPKRMLFERIIPKLGDFLKLDKGFDYEDFCIALSEYEAGKGAADKFKIYDFEELLTLAKKVSLDPEKDDDPQPLIPVLSTIKSQAGSRGAIRCLLKGI